MSLSNSERQEFESIVRAALEPALHELEVRIAASFAQACDMWANLIADIQFRQAEQVMAKREEDRKKFLEERNKSSQAVAPGHKFPWEK